VLNRPLSDFVAHFPNLAVRAVSEAVTGRVRVFQDEIRRVEFELPPEVEGIGFCPIGTPGARKEPLDLEADRVLVVSPFLCDRRLPQLTEHGAGNILVSRQEELDRLDPSHLGGFEQQYVLSLPAHEEPSGEEEPEPAGEPLSGLHAKIYVAEYGWNARVWIGSANATAAALDRNVEFLVELRGKRSALGIDRLMRREKDETSFADLLQPYSPPEAPIAPDPVEERLKRLLFEIRTSIATSRWRLQAVEEPAGNTTSYRVALVREDSKPLAWDNGAVRVSCWPVSLRQESAAKPLGSPYPGETDLGTLSVDALTTLLAFEVVASEAGREMTCRFALNLPLLGGPPDRRDAVIRSLLKDKAKVLRFLLFLLASDVIPGGVDLDLFGDGTSSGEGRPDRHQAPLLESLLRSLDREPTRLDAVASLVADLRKSDETRDLFPDGFGEVWDTIWAARQELLR